MNQREAKRFASLIISSLCDVVTVDYLDYHFRQWERDNEERLTDLEKKRIVASVATIAKELKRKSEKSEYNYDSKVKI